MRRWTKGLGVAVMMSWLLLACGGLRHQAVTLSAADVRAVRALPAEGRVRLQIDGERTLAADRVAGAAGGAPLLDAARGEPNRVIGHVLVNRGIDVALGLTVADEENVHERIVAPFAERHGRRRSPSPANRAHVPG